MTIDHKAALMLATEWHHFPAAFSERTIAAAYLELREAAMPFANWPPEPPMSEKISALRKLLEVEK